MSHNSSLFTSAKNRTRPPILSHQHSCKKIGIFHKIPSIYPTQKKFLERLGLLTRKNFAELNNIEHKSLPLPLTKT